MSKHDATWDLYAGEYNDKNESIGENGRDLKDLRHVADYGSSTTVSSGDAILAIKQAEKIIADLSKLT